MAADEFSKDFPLDAGIFTSAKLDAGAASKDANAAAAILANEKFLDGDIELGHISFTADTGKAIAETGDPSMGRR